MKIYVASSWRNVTQPLVVEELRKEGHEVYDFKNPPNRSGFAWSDIDPNWKEWSHKEYLSALDHRLADEGFASDFNAMKWADACVLVMPCGRSAHVEAGWMQGAGKPTIILLNGASEPELMYKLFDLVTNDLEKVKNYLNGISSFFTAVPSLL